MTHINLILEPPSERGTVYYPGQVVKGTVELLLESTKSFRGFYVTVFGQARAHWTETRSSTTGTGKNRRTTHHTVHFEGKEIYLNSKTYLFGQSGGSAFDVQPGSHKYNFACQLPEQLPATFDGVHGEIRYYVEAVLDIPWRFDKEVKTPITIVRHDDLNLYPELRVAQAVEEVKTFCCLFCESGPLLMQATIPQSGFAKGQYVPIKIHYSNKSDTDVLSTSIKLRRLINFKSTTPHEKTKSDNEKMVEVNCRGVKAGESVTLENTIDIPSIMMSSNGRFCRVIQIEYFIQVEAHVDGCHTNPELLLPITIGSEPLRVDNQYAITPGANVQIQPIQPPVQYQPSAPVEEQFKNDLPPSFDEAIKMPMPENSAFMPQSTSANLGWNVSTPSAPLAEKNNL
ncbi:arrestin domain-containing protein 3-like [Chironomus tepperi]|uniref:arrestin domain-containing protein 3-like n=1 Tax=Chironomus tepperi TaxID=113505 RepID=UPI00391EE6AF